MKNEKILWEGKPEESLKKYFMITWSLWTSFILAATFIGVVVIPFGIIASVFLAKQAYEKRYYWITNKRIVYKRGILGYQVSSIPMERVSDVILSRTWIESILGFGSLHIQTLAGQVSRGAGGSEGDLKAVPQPEKVQQIILANLKN